MKYHQLLILLIMMSSCDIDNSHELGLKSVFKKEIKKENDVREYPTYDFDTLLSGGYHLAYNLKLGKVKSQNLILMKGNIEIIKLNETSAGMLHKNLGYIGADLADYFIFCNSYGSGNPTDIQLIEKKTGKTIRKGSWVDVDTNEMVVLYISNIHKDDEELKLFDLKNQKEVTITDFNNCHCVKEVIFGMRACVKIKNVSNTEIVLFMEYKNEKIIKKYYR